MLYAALAGQTHVVQQLVENNANVDARSALGFTALLTAAANGPSPVSCSTWMLSAYDFREYNYRRRYAFCRGFNPDGIDATLEVTVLKRLLLAGG